MYFKADVKIIGDDYLLTYNVLRVGDIAFEGHRSKEFAYGRFVENTIGDGIISHVFVVFRPILPSHNIVYWQYAINNERTMRGVLARCTKAATMMMSIVPSDFLSQKILVPSNNEQAKIGSLLSLVDARIAAQRRLVGLLKKHKRGMLREVFEENSEGDYRPFSEIAERRSDKIAPAPHSTLACIELEHIEPETGRLLGNAPLRGQNSLKNLCRPNDIIFGRLRPYLRKFAFVETECAASSETWVLVAVKGILPRFLFHLIQSEPFMRAASVSSGTKMPRSEWTNVAGAQFRIPDEDRQRSISECFQHLDNRIQASIRIVDALESLKRGLFQGLFV